MNTKIALGFMSFLDRLGDSLDGTGELFEGVLDPLQGGRDGFEDFGLWVCFGNAHESGFA